LEKVLQDADIKLSSVASGVWSKSSREIVEAMITGERDPAVLAQMAKSRMRTKIAQLEEALSGRFGEHHAVVCRQVIDHIDYLDQQSPSSRLRSPPGSSLLREQSPSCARSPVSLRSRPR